MLKFYAALILLGAVLVCRAELSLPPYIEGTPQSAQVVSLEAPDYRGLPVYKITFDVRTSVKTSQYGIVHRQYGEFYKLVGELAGNGNWNLPDQDSDTVLEELSEFLQSVIADEDTRDSAAFSDFLGINWNAQGVEWFEDMQTFLHMVMLARLPLFPPEPPYIPMEQDVTAPETPFEKYVYLFAFKQDNIDNYIEFFSNYTKLTPKFSGEADDLDVRPSNAQSPLQLPYHYTRAVVHFLPGGYLNGQTVRISFCGKNKFNFLHDSLIQEWVQRLNGHLKPKRILDIGTGNCHSALIYAKIFPDAEVIGIDLAAPYVRFCRIWAEQLGVTNVKFYQDNGESTSFEDNSFDIIQYTYVLHEMPAENAVSILTESFRLLKPGGTLTGFEVPYMEDPMIRAMMIATQTWGYKWDSDGPHGPEPYTYEYQERFIIPDKLAQVGFINNTETILTRFDGVYQSYKPLK